MKNWYVPYVQLVSIGLCSAQYSLAGLPLVATEQLGRPSDTSITLNVIAGFACDAYVKYGTTAGVYEDSTTIQSFSDTQAVVIELNNLQGNTKYWYRFCYKGVTDTAFIERDEHFFQTARAKGETYSFTILADDHLQDKKGIAELMTVTMNNQLKNIPDFFIDMGDNFGDDHNPTTITGQQIRDLRLNMRQYYGMMSHSSPFFNVNGNHEGESGYWLNQLPPDNMAVNATLWRKFYYNNPQPNGFYTGNATPEPYGIGLPENYYSFVWGDAEFIILDSYRGYTANAKPRNWDWTLGKTQFDWFKATLAKSTAKYKFVFAHHVTGESRGGKLVAYDAEWGDSVNFEANRPGWGGIPIHQLMKKYGVTVFFQGHDHIFAKEDVDGIVYQTCPMPADSTYLIGITDNGSAFMGDTLMGSGYVRVTVNPDSAKVEFVTSVLPRHVTPALLNDSVSYSYSVTGDSSVVTPVASSALSTEQMGISVIGQNLHFSTPLSGLYRITLWSVNGRILYQRDVQSAKGENILPLPKGLTRTLSILKISGKGVNAVKILR